MEKIPGANPCLQPKYFNMMNAIPIALLTLASLIVLRIAIRRAVLFIAGVSAHLPAQVAGSPDWSRLQGATARLAELHPKLMALLARRFYPDRPTGLLLTLIVLAALYLLTLFSGLAEDVLESQGIVHSDNVVNAALGPWRVEPFVSVFLKITDFGSTAAIVAVVLVATGFLWPLRGSHVVLALLVSCVGAVSTTTIGKLLVARHRPEFTLDVTAPGWSFPSGHATVATAVYGFIAYAMTRALPGFRERFEVGFWAAILILLVGFSRIFLGVHYVTDVLGGFMVGAFWLLIGVSMVECLTPSDAPSSTRNGK